MLMQKELHPGIFAVVDGTVCGNGAGPRTMSPEVKNYLLAGADQVAVDAVAAKMMGFDPLKIGYLRMCHEREIGCKFWFPGAAQPRNRWRSAYPAGLFAPPGKSFAALCDGWLGTCGL
jgi:uncharacterized protein (DUF362 family)